ncbi:hypothetical protein SDC9_46739 [bioreactor metagenome]|uniref:Uncharacterized protein n=1 Tax=bioreactor metagenome TaxID=1076179 RepID=A0A644WD69_9ZZZZ
MYLMINKKIREVYLFLPYSYLILAALNAIIDEINPNNAAQ